MPNKLCSLIFKEKSTILLKKKFKNAKRKKKSTFINGKKIFFKLLQ